MLISAHKKCYSAQLVYGDNGRPTNYSPMHSTATTDRLLKTTP